MTNSGEHDTAANIDVAAILEELRAEVRARRLALGQDEPGPFEREVQRALDEIELHRVVSAHWPLTGRTLPQRAIALLNKLVRRYLRWYINPIVEQQNAYNDAVARALRLLADAYADLGEQVAAAGEGRATDDGRWTMDDGGDAGEGQWAMGDGPQTADSRQQTADSRQPGSTPASQFSILNSQFSIQELPAHFPDLELRALEPQLRLRERVIAHWPLTDRTLPQRAVALLNKLVRRYLRWYINPIVEQQNAANAATTAALLALIRLDAERRAAVAALRAAKLRVKS